MMTCSHDVTIQWYASPSALVGLGTCPYTIIVTDRAVRCTKAHVMTLMWSMTTVEDDDDVAYFNVC